MQTRYSETLPLASASRLDREMEFGQALKDLRTKAGLTQQEIADHVHVDRAHVSHIENGRRQPSIELLTGWVYRCGGSVTVLGANEKPDPLSGLTQEQRAVVQAVLRYQLPVEDITRIIGIIHALGTTDGLARNLLTNQLDGIIEATRRVSDSGAEVRRAM